MITKDWWLKKWKMLFRNTLQMSGANSGKKLHFLHENLSVIERPKPGVSHLQEGREHSWKQPVTWPPSDKKTLRRCANGRKKWRELFMKTILQFLAPGRLKSPRSFFTHILSSHQLHSWVDCLHSKKKKKKKKQNPGNTCMHMTRGRWGVPAPCCCRRMWSKEAEVSLTWVLNSPTQI